MARPREFDIDTAVENAMLVFWKNGYSDAGLSELCQAMGIVRGSFYKAFGSKKSLFLKVLQRYERDYVDGAVDELKNGSGAGATRIEQIFNGSLGVIKGGDIRGCLLCNTASGTSMEDSEIRQAITGQLEKLTDGFQFALQADQPELSAASPANQSLRARARQLTLRYVGLRILGRGGFDSAALEDGLRDLAPL